MYKINVNQKNRKIGVLEVCLIYKNHGGIIEK